MIFYKKQTILTDQNINSSNDELRDSIERDLINTQKYKVERSAAEVSSHFIMRTC